MSAEDDSAMDIDEESSSKLMNGGELTIPDAPSEEVNEDPKYGQKDTVNEKKDEDGSGNGSAGKLKSDSTSVPSTVPSTADPSLINGSINGIAPSATNNINGTVSTSQQNGGTGTGTGTGSSGVHTPSKTSGNKRIDVDNIMSDFQKALGDNWDRYREVITQFLIGKLTRGELQEELDHVLDKNTIHMHNHFLLANLANAFRDPPPGERGMLNGWSKRQKDPSRNVKGDSQLTKLKEDIMGLSVRERKRIKAIARESGKRAPIPSTITATRQAMLPKIPFVNDKEKLNNQQPKTPNAPIATPIPSQQGNIIHAYETPLASEVYEIPDSDSLTARMLGISLEHGLLQGVDSGTAEFMLAGLEHYLKDVVQQIFERVNRLGERIMTAEDIASLAYTSPNLFVEHTSALYRLHGTMLQDEEDEEDEEELMDVEANQPSDLDLLLKEILGR